MINDIIQDAIANRSLLFVTGKGGIGKTLVSTAIGLRAASQGKNVCLVEAGAKDQIPQLFGQNAVGHNLTMIQSNLYSMNLDGDLNFRDFIVKHLGFERLFNRVFSNSVMKSFVKLIPGINEMTLLGRLFYFCELCTNPKFDLVIFDSYASGHFMSLINTPKAVLESGLIGPVIDETQRVKSYLQTPSCGVIVVTQGEELVMNETIELIDFFNEANRPNLDGIIMNRAPEVLISDDEWSQLAIDNPGINQCLQRLADDQKRFKDAHQKLLNHMSTTTNPVPIGLATELGSLNIPIDLNQINQILTS